MASLRLEPDVYFWRDSAGHEVDLVIEAGSEVTAVEAKSGQTFSLDFLKGLDYWRGLPGNAHAPAAVVYGGDESYRRQSTAVLSWRVWG